MLPLLFQAISSKPELIVSAVESEEQRRVWWGIWTLDRCVCLESHVFILACYRMVIETKTVGQVCYSGYDWPTICL